MQPAVSSKSSRKSRVWELFSRKHDDKAGKKAHDTKTAAAPACPEPAAAKGLPNSSGGDSNGGETKDVAGGVALSTFDSQIPSTVKWAGAIDFGTSACGAGLRSLSTDLKVEAGVVPLSTDRAQSKIPTSLLLNDKYICIEFGERAEQRYRNECTIDPAKREKLYYFRYIKMHLYKYGSKTKSATAVAAGGAFPDLKAENGTPVPALTVFAAALCYLKDTTVAHINKVYSKSIQTAIEPAKKPPTTSGGGSAGQGAVAEVGSAAAPPAISASEKALTATTTYVADDIVWIVTVPMIWTYRARKFMLDAAVKAGIKHVSIGLEPECGALACRADAERTKLTAAAGNKPHVYSPNGLSIGSLSFDPNAYMVVDCGGGTIDIAVCRVVDDEKNEIDDITPPEGNDLGSRAINREFERFMAGFIGVEAFAKFQATKPGVWSAMLEGSNDLCFERLKTGYKPVSNPDTYGDHRHIALALPVGFRGFVTTEKVDLVKCVQVWNKKNPPPRRANDQKTAAVSAASQQDELANKELSLFRSSEDEELYLALPCWLFRRFVMAVVTPIVKLVTDMLTTVPKCRIVYVIGGFSQCELLMQALETLPKILLKSVAFPHLCVLKGAVIAAVNPTAVRQRVLTATYGVSTYIPWKPEYPARRFRKIESNNKEFAEGGFYTVAKKWDSFKANQMAHVMLYPIELSQKLLRAQVFYHRLDQPAADGIKWCDEPGVFFTTGTRELVLPPPSEPLKSTDDRPIRVNLKLGATVITYSITDMITGNTTAETTFNHFD